MKKIVIAIDGYSGCGKSTTAKAVAKSLSYIFIDTGAMYRAVALYFLRKGINFSAETPELREALAQVHLEFRLNEKTQTPEMFLNGENVEQDIRSMEVSSVVSEVSTLAVVRRDMVAQQQRMGKARGIVMDGRDIGTVVFPDAELKIFMTASVEARIQRRKLELAAKGQALSDADIRKNLEHRDHIDSTRAESPLRRAEDAVLLDNSDMSIEEQVEFVSKLAQERLYSGV